MAGDPQLTRTVVTPSPDLNQHGPGTQSPTHGTSAITQLQMGGVTHSPYLKPRKGYRCIRMGTESGKRPGICGGQRAYSRRTMLYVITGPPCAGKSTWIRQRAKPGDVVVDLDRIALAITSEDTPHHEYPKHIRTIAVAIRRQLVQMAMRASRMTDAYIINSKPTSRARADYYRAGATFIHLDAPLETLVERAKAERPAWVMQALLNWNTEPDEDV